MHKCLISKVFTNIDKESEKIKFIAAQKISNSKTDFIGWVRSNTTTYLLILAKGQQIAEEFFLSSNTPKKLTKPFTYFCPSF